jgi:hypothetical protein
VTDAPSQTSGTTGTVTGSESGVISEEFAGNRVLSVLMAGAMIGIVLVLLAAIRRNR